MPRAFLITNRRYNSNVEYEQCQVARDNSPERSVRTAEDPANETSTDYKRPLKPASPKSPASMTRAPDPPLICQQQQQSTETLGLQLTVQSLPRRDLMPQLQHAVDAYPSVIVARGNVKSLHHTVLAAVMQQIMGNNGDLPSPVIPTAGSQDTHVCPECGKRYSTSSNLARHRQTHRSVTDKKARKCPHCEKVYVSMPAYSMHVRTHSQGCQCPYCGKCFSRPWLLQGHIRTHTGEKPFKCPICSKAFADKSNLRAHIQTHSTSKPYVCQRCGKAFALKSYLYKHEESSCMRLHRQQMEPQHV